LRRDELSLVIVAQDRSERTDEKVTRLARARGIEVLEGPRADELGRRLGRESVQTAGVKDPHLAAGLRGQTAAQDI
jgi:ribosomal protein L7Ae-like RNA K-turn-binding protein